MIFDKIINLNFWKRGDMRAPHKPLLILYAIGRLKDRYIPYKDIDKDLLQMVAERSKPSNVHHLTNVINTFSFIMGQIPPIRTAYPRHHFDFNHLTDEQKIKLGVANSQRGKDMLEFLKRNVHYLRELIKLYRLLHHTLDELKNDLEKYNRGVKNTPWPQAHIDNSRVYVYQMILVTEIILRINHKDIGLLQP